MASSFLPVLEPDDVAEIRNAAAWYEASLAGASQELIVQLFGTLSTAFPNQRLSEAEADTKLDLYCRALADVPADALNAAVTRVLKTQTFFPSIAEIRQAASPHFEPRRLALHACRRLILKHEREYQAPVSDKSDWTEDDVAAANADFRRCGIKTRYRLDPERPGAVLSDHAGEAA